MNKSKLVSSSSSQLTNSMNVRGLTSPTAKKVEGFDKPTPFLDKLNADRNNSNGFANKIQKLRHKPKTEIVEEQYIKGLQDQIGYLEIELKLLQEKDIQKHGQIDQLEQFFGDGIPINENILAMKNGFKNYQTNAEERTVALLKERQERSTLIEGLQRRVEETAQQVVESEGKLRENQKKEAESWKELIKKEALIHKQLESQEEELKEIKQENRKIADKIEKITRNKLMENIAVLRNQNHKLTRLNLLRESLKQKSEEAKQLQKQHQSLAKQQSELSYVIKLEETNLGLKKRAIFTERDFEGLKSKLKEKKIELEEKLKERLVQIECKLEIKEKIEQVKERIARENAMTSEEIESYGKESEIFTLQRIVEENFKTSKYIDHYSNILSIIEENVQEMASRKPDIKSEIQAYAAELELLHSSLKEEKCRRNILHAEQATIDHESQQYKATFGPLSEKASKHEDETRAYTEEKEVLTNDILVKQKQLQMIYIVKNLSFEETEMSKNSSNNIQEELLHFLRSWDKIQKIK